MIKFLINFLFLSIFIIPVFSDYENDVDESLYLDKIERYRDELKVMEDAKYIIYSEEAETDMTKFETEDVFHYIVVDDDDLI